MCGACRYNEKMGKRKKRPTTGSKEKEKSINKSIIKNDPGNIQSAISFHLL
jgi:hypothetical protein